VQDNCCFGMHHVHLFTSVCSIALGDRASRSRTCIRSLPHVQWFGRIFSILNAQQQELRLVNLRRSLTFSSERAGSVSAADAVGRASTVASTPADKQHTMVACPAACVLRLHCCCTLLGHYITESTMHLCLHLWVQPLTPPHPAPAPGHSAAGTPCPHPGEAARCPSNCRA
jgi:hypothetical protein